MASFTSDDAAHLLRRAGFGGSPAEIETLVSRGREGAVDYLINYNQIDNKAMNDLLDRSFNFSNPLERVQVQSSRDATLVVHSHGSHATPV